MNKDKETIKSILEDKEKIKSMLKDIKSSRKRSKDDFIFWLLVISYVIPNFFWTSNTDQIAIFQIISLILPFCAFNFIFEKLKNNDENALLDILFIISVFNMLSLSWLKKPFEIANIKHLARLCLLLLSILLALFYCFSGWVFQKLSPKIFENLNNIKYKEELLSLLFATCFTMAEFCIGHVFGGFPWNISGYLLADTKIVILASTVKIYGLCFIFFLIASFPTVTYRLPEKFSQISRNAINIVVNLIICTIIATCYESTYYKNDDYMKNAESFINKIQIVQPNIKQENKWKKELAKNNLSRCIETSKFEPNQIIIWPEAAIPYTIHENSELIKYLGSLIPEKSLLITGCIFQEDHNQNSEEKIFNSLIVINNQGVICGRYNKVKLAPFGEYVPFKFIPFIKKITNNMKDFTAGKYEKNSDKIIKLRDNFSFFPLICYDDVFPISKTTADCIILLTNDSWFEGTIGKYQHLKIAKVRAIEANKILIRCANSGISAIISPKGEFLATAKNGEIQNLKIK